MVSTWYLDSQVPLRPMYVHILYFFKSIVNPFNHTLEIQNECIILDNILSVSVEDISRDETYFLIILPLVKVMLIAIPLEVFISLDTALISFQYNWVIFFYDALGFRNWIYL